MQKLREPVERHELGQREARFFTYRIGAVVRTTAVARVDARDRPSIFCADFHVGRHIGARRHANLDEDEPLAQVRPLVEQAVDRREPLGNALRVVEPVDADADDLPLAVQPQLGRPRLCIWPGSASSARIA